MSELLLSLGITPAGILGFVFGSGVRGLIRDDKEK
jgi:hypothetical protein